MASPKTINKDSRRHWCYCGSDETNQQQQTELPKKMTKKERQKQ